MWDLKQFRNYANTDTLGVGRQIYKALISTFSVLRIMRGQICRGVKRGASENAWVLHAKGYETRPPRPTYRDDPQSLDIHQVEAYSFAMQSSSVSRKNCIAHLWQQP